MRSIFEWDRACNPKYECGDFLINGDQATVIMREENDFTRLLNFAGWETKLELRFTPDGKIKEELVILLGSGPSFEEKLQPALDWLGAHYPDDLAEIYPNDQFVFSGENARGWIGLLREWREAVGLPKINLGGAE